VAGLREIKKYLIVKKISALLIAPGNGDAYLVTRQLLEQGPSKIGSMASIICTFY
jgi:hypothetical protein